MNETDYWSIINGAIKLEKEAQIKRAAGRDLLLKLCRESIARLVEVDFCESWGFVGLGSLGPNEYTLQPGRRIVAQSILPQISRIQFKYPKPGEVPFEKYSDSNLLYIARNIKRALKEYLGEQLVT